MNAPGHHRFAELHQGGRLARDIDGDFRPWKLGGQPVAAHGDYYEIISGHLAGDCPIGVYPLLDDTVHWGAIDWDLGDEESLIHAVNVHAVLEAIGIATWVELSRSKGCHLWLYCAEWMPARTMRLALIAACGLVDAPITEVYPKQETADGGWGNGLRLPYPKVRPMGRQCVVTPQLTEWSFYDFVETAFETRATAESIVSLAKRAARPTPPPPPTFSQPDPSRPRRSRHDGGLTGLAQHIWDNGPRMADNGTTYDRSRMLHTFACELFRQDYDTGSIEMLVARLDQRWGQKFVARRDGAQRIKDLVGKARGVYMQPKLGTGESERST